MRQSRIRMVVLTACFSADGKHLLCATASGWAHVWRMKPIEQMTAPELVRSSARLHNSQIYSVVLSTVQGIALLISSSDHEICGWNWEALLAGSADPIPVFQLTRGGAGHPAEINALSLDLSCARLYAASGDGNAYGWDLASQRCRLCPLCLTLPTIDPECRAATALCTLPCALCTTGVFPHLRGTQTWCIAWHYARDTSS